MLIAITTTAIGYGIDAGSGHKELTGIFVGLYIAGCVVAVLAVRQDGLFSAVIQPPLILFCAVPGAYWLFHDGKVGNIKDLLINCGYPLIERFPLMLGTAGGVLLIGLVRWYFGKLRLTTTTASTSEDTATATDNGAKSFVGGIAAKLSSMLRVDSDEDEAGDESPTDSKRARAAGARKRTAANTSRAARGGRSAARSTRARSRHGRPSLEDEQEPVVERRRRRQAPRDYDPAEPPRRSRRPRPEADPDPRSQPPREPRRDPRTRRNPYERPSERPMPRSSRFDGYDRYEPPGAPERSNRYEPYEPYEPYERPRRRPAPNGTNGADPTHHPISQVRYRASAPSGEPSAEPEAEPHVERRGRSRRPPSESWEYDV